MKSATNKTRVSRAEALNVAQAALSKAEDRMNAAAKAVREASELTPSEAKVDELQQLTRERYATNISRIEYVTEPSARIELVATLNGLLDDDARCDGELAIAHKNRVAKQHKAECEAGTARQQFEAALVDHNNAQRAFRESFPVLADHS